MSLEPLCEPKDVSAALGGATLPEDQVTMAIAVASEWLRTELGKPELGQSGTVVTTEQDVRCDAFVRAPATVSKVEALRVAGGTAEELSGSSWTYDGDGVRLRPAESGPWGADPRYTAADEENSLPWWYVSVTVTSTVSATIDPRIRMACAVAAGALVTRLPRVTRGVRGENIGDYSYTLEQIQHEDPFFEQARSLARPLSSRGPFVV